MNKQEVVAKLSRGKDIHEEWINYLKLNEDQSDGLVEKFVGDENWHKDWIDIYEIAIKMIKTYVPD